MSRHKRTIIKVTADQVVHGGGQFTSSPGQCVLTQWPRSKDEWPSGRVALSFKVGKKRRLVSGKIEGMPIPSRDGLHWELIFTPTEGNVGKIQKLAS